MPPCSILNGNECNPLDYTGGLRLQRPNLPVPHDLHRHEYCRNDVVYAREAGMWGRRSRCRLLPLVVIVLWVTEVGLCTWWGW